MIILPAIDLMSGQVVRLTQGKAETKVVYDENPAAVALKWETQGGEYLHLVDLDAAFEGTSKNLDAVRSVCQALKIPCELGGGIRDIPSIERIFEAGVTRAIIGSRACESLDFVDEAVKRFGGERIAIGIDAKDGIVATKGWTALSEWKVIDLARKVQDLGVKTIIYTDIATDGMLQGPNIPALEAMLEAIEVQLVASGGVSSVEDIRKLNELPGLYGVIVGKALYEKKIRLEECLSITQ